LHARYDKPGALDRRLSCLLLRPRLE